jgi:hypothetical protein
VDDCREKFDTVNGCRVAAVSARVTNDKDTEMAPGALQDMYTIMVKFELVARAQCP